MKLARVRLNNRKKSFEATTRSGRTLSFPYVKADPSPTRDDPVVTAYVDPEVGREGFTYSLASGAEGTVLTDHLLEYNEDPRYLRDLLVYRLTVEALDELERSPLSRREICRRLRTSPAQLYRLLDPTNSGKSLDKMVELLQALDCEVSLTVARR